MRKLKILTLSYSILPLILTGCAETQVEKLIEPQSATVPMNPALIDYREDNKGDEVFPLRRTPSGKAVFVFDPSHTAWAIYDETGERIKTGRASGGRAYCPDIKRPCRTTVGHFRVIRKLGADCVSTIFPLGEGGSPMPYCMFFNGGYAVHGSYEIPDYNASHGCIRITPSAAQWLSENYMNPGTEVIVLPYRSANIEKEQLNID